MDQRELFPEVCTDGLFKGYKRLHWIHSAATRIRPQEKMHNLMHHLNTHNLRRAYRSLDGSKAAGIDQITKEKYGETLSENLGALEQKLRGGGWRPRPSRQVLIPKADGGTRPLAVGCLEDKIVQTLTARILDALYEPLFYPQSDGFRRGKSCKQAMSRLYRVINARKNRCVVVEVDIEKFFDSMDHDWLMDRLAERIGDPHFLRLIRRQLRNSIRTESGEMKLSEMGTPQGSPVSPVLANVCLHHLLDEWFMQSYSDTGEFIRYADDAVFVFSDVEEAHQFLHALHVRCAQAGLRVNLQKSKVIELNHSSPKGTAKFLGFELYWGRDLKGQRFLKAKTDDQRLYRALHAFTDWIKRCRNRHRLDALWLMAAAKLRGHFEYFGVRTNTRRLRHFYHACIAQLFKWLNRRSQKRSFTWQRFSRRLWFKPLPAPPFERELVDLSRNLDSEWNRNPKSRMRKSRTSGSVRSAGQQPAFT